MRIHALGLTTALLLSTGCAPKVPTELVNARDAYQSASDDQQVNELVPAELHKARVALDEAEKAFDDHPRGYHAADLAYVADRKAQTAIAKAAIYGANEDTASAANELTAVQTQIMKDTRADLDTSNQSLALSRQDSQHHKHARIEADNRTKAALAALAHVQEEERGLVVTLMGSTLFREGEAELLPGARARLDQMGSALMDAESRPIIIEGHTDSQGTHASNKALSQRRADAVKSYLMSRGYDGSAIEAVGVGQDRPIAGNDTADGRANNLRVEIVVKPDR